MKKLKSIILSIMSAILPLSSASAYMVSYGEFGHQEYANTELFKTEHTDISNFCKLCREGRIWKADCYASSISKMFDRVNRESDSCGEYGLQRVVFCASDQSPWQKSLSPVYPDGRVTLDYKHIKHICWGEFTFSKDGRFFNHAGGHTKTGLELLTCAWNIATKRDTAAQEHANTLSVFNEDVICDPVSLTQVIGKIISGFKKDQLLSANKILVKSESDIGTDSKGNPTKCAVMFLHNWNPPGGQSGQAKSIASFYPISAEEYEAYKPMQNTLVWTQSSKERETIARK